MARGLEGRTIVLTGSRRSEEMKILVEKQGGIPLLRPAQGTLYSAEEEVGHSLQQIVNDRMDWFVFTTGVGTETLLKIAESLGILDRYVTMIKNADVAVRGYKTLSVLKKIGVHPTVVDDDGTTQGLIRSLTPFKFRGQKVAIQLHGDTAPKLIQYLEENGANPLQLLPYQHTPPNTQVMEMLYHDIVEGKIHAICFTTALQVRYLFDYVRENQQVPNMLEMFKEKVVVAAVGKITAEALNEEGITNVVQPDKQRMGAMIMKLSQYYMDKKQQLN